MKSSLRSPTMIYYYPMFVHAIIEIIETIELLFHNKRVTFDLFAQDYQFFILLRRGSVGAAVSSQYKLYQL
jgi:hypothetical protein